MECNRVNKVKGIILLALIIAVILIGYKIFGPGANDIKSAKEFMTKIYSIDAVDKNIDLKDIKYEVVKKLNSQNELVDKSILTQSYGIDIDKNNNVIGFAKKDILRNGVEHYNISEAQERAEEYLNSIYHEKVLLKNIITKENEEMLPYYSFIFVRVKDDHPFYFDEIKVNINKENGFLDGYSNTAMQREYKEPNIKISKEEAEKVAIETFNKYNTNAEIQHSNYDLVFAENALDKEKNTTEELCYMVIISGKDDNNNEIEWKIFVNSENVNIFNILKDGVENKVITEN